MILNAFLILRYMYNIRHLNTCIYIYTNTLYYMKEINEKKSIKGYNRQKYTKLQRFSLHGHTVTLNKHNT